MRFGSGAARRSTSISVRATRARASEISRSQSAWREGVRDQLLAQFGQRIAGFFRGDFLGGLVGLGVLARVAGEARHHQPDQRRPFAGPHAGHRVFDQRRGGERIGTIALEHAQSTKAREIPGNVAARGLLLRTHGNSIAIVFNEEQERQSLGGHDIERRPESIGGRRCFAAVRDGNAAAARLLAELILSDSEAPAPIRPPGCIARRRRRTPAARRARLCAAC